MVSNMTRPLLLLSCISLLLLLSFGSADVVEHTFLVHSITMRRMCKEQPIVAVNGSFPGPTIYAHEGDTLVVHVINNSPYNLSIHWHGVFQLLSNWQDGPEYVTQCPILPGNNFTYRYNIIEQEGTFWWHAHSGFLRATVHGALVIRPKLGRTYPFPKPNAEVPIIIGEWYNADVVELEKELLVTGIGPNYSDGYTINGWPGDFYSCSSDGRRILDEPRDPQFSTLEQPSSEAGHEPGIYKLKVAPKKRYLLRIINAALHDHMFFKIASHLLTVVAVDACYTNPYQTDVVILSAGQTVDVLITTDQPSRSYYMASHSYNSEKSPRYYLLSPGLYDTTTSALLVYDGAKTSTLPIIPILPAINDTKTAFRFSNSLTGLVTSPFWSPVPRKVDEHMFITVGLGLLRCTYKDNRLCKGPLNQFIAASANNVSFRLPTKMSILQAHYNKVKGIYTEDFPNEPPYKFNYTNEDQRLDEKLIWTETATKVKKLKYNATVEIVFQSTVLVAVESHPIHLHGFNFHVLAQGFGNYDLMRDQKKFNLVNPQMRNTVAIPIGGWIVIRFQANNPGAWYMHCHLEAHVPIGLATVFVVEDGPTPTTKLPPPPADYPMC